ncbi:hypothetical protein [Stutzerimonas stutzeri]|uniref:hypothetical protein n=1 Tax=Stutzerimonas stutzeri TaxID=316 RepID=UPI0012D4BBEC|nr:hypothetical protein [Stutzerimonas stutzeri]
MDDLELLTCLSDGEFVSEETRQILSTRYFWLVKTLRELNAPGSKSIRRKIFAFLLVMAVWEQRLQVRQQVLRNAQVTDKFLAELVVLVESYTLQIAVPDDAPLNQKELFERMTAADQAEDWQDLIDIAQRFPLPEPEGWFRQAVCYLYQLAPDRLADALINSPDWIHVAMTLRALTQAEAFAIAARTPSARVTFVALVLVSIDNELSEGACQASLKAMLSALSLELLAWKRILEAFNCYPVRYPWLQHPLGEVLASANLEAIEAYVEVLPISTSKGCAAQVERCLSRFRGRASDEARLVLWHRAYKKWDSWERQQPGTTALTNPMASTLDYAVLGWLKEGCTDAFVASELKAIEQQINSLEHEWYESVTAFHGKLNALLSRYQVFAHAHESPRADWTAQIMPKRPPTLGSDYAMARYGI